MLIMFGASFEGFFCTSRVVTLMLCDSLSCDLSQGSFIVWHFSCDLLSFDLLSFDLSSCSTSQSIDWNGLMDWSELCWFILLSDRDWFGLCEFFLHFNIVQITKWLFSNQIFVSPCRLTVGGMLLFIYFSRH